MTSLTEMTTVRRRVRVLDPMGLHVRPCAAVAGEVRRFRCTVELRSTGRSADARSVMELLGLAAGAGSDIEIAASGDDAPECVESIVRILTESSSIE